MSDYLTSGFRAQLNTAMESLLNSLVGEVMRIFENSLHDHQMELVRKGEEVAHLNIKLQSAEIKLRKLESGGASGVQASKTRMLETQHVPEVALNHQGQTSVPEIDFEVPDDWCAPLGHEMVTKQDDVVCPRVANHDVDSKQPTKGVRRSQRCSPMHYQQKKRNSVRNNRKKLLFDIKQQYSDRTDSIDFRRRGKKLTGKKQDYAGNSRKGERKIPATKPDSIEQWTAVKRYSCKFCKKVFNTEFGHRVHVRSHKRCRGCKKDFPYPSTLKNHTLSCNTLKIVLAKKASKMNPPTPESCGEEKLGLPRKRTVSIKNNSSAPTGNYSESSLHEDGSSKMHSCAFCNMTCPSSSSLEEHLRVHSSEKAFPCSRCTKKFDSNRALNVHFTRMHQNQIDSSETNGDLAWTIPLEDTEDNRENGISSSKRHKSHH